MHRPRLKSMLRISLRTLFVLTTILCVWLGMKVRQVERQKEVVRWIEEMGGTAVHGYVFKRPEGTNEHVLYNTSNPPGPDWLCELVGVDYFSTVTFVGLHYTQVSDLSPLANLSDLETLSLIHTPVTDVSPLLTLTNLRLLWLDETAVTEEDIAKLKETLPNCEISW